MAGAVSDGPSVRAESPSNAERETTTCDLRSNVERSIVVLTNRQGRTVGGKVRLRDRRDVKDVVGSYGVGHWTPK